MTNVYTHKKLSIKAKAVVTFAALTCAVLLPQACHLFGGIGLGELLLPMHLPIILAGLLAGPAVGALSGALAPIISFALTGMPLYTMLPFMVIELCAYGLVSGLMANVRTPSILKVLVAQISGRILKIAALFITFYGFGGSISPVSVINAIKVGVIGIALQLIIIPLVMYAVNHAEKKS